MQFGIFVENLYKLYMRQMRLVAFLE
uniref:Uncharacterized protein n=1 Tax=Arundo donax TaxID=35708 RepID=A0A0A8ZXU2_ARUDO